MSGTLINSRAGQKVYRNDRGVRKLFHEYRGKHIFDFFVWIFLNCWYFSCMISTLFSVTLLYKVHTILITTSQDYIRIRSPDRCLRSVQHVALHQEAISFVLLIFLLWGNTIYVIVHAQHDSLYIISWRGVYAEIREPGLFFLAHRD